MANLKMLGGVIISGVVCTNMAFSPYFNSE